MNRILINVFWGDTRPFISGSVIDSALLQSATYAHERIKQGYTDSFLFLFCGVDSETKANNVVARYAFPNLTIICIPADYEGNQLEYINDHEMYVSIHYEIDRWLSRNHSASLPYPGSDEYEILDAWWSGIEAPETDWNWINSFSNSLPDTHKKRACTWIELLKENNSDSWSSWSDEQNFALQTASLCEWLHGFESASENNFNCFEATPHNFGLDGEYVAFYAGKYDKEDDDFIIEEADNGVHFASQALSIVLGHKRHSIASELKKYFNGEGALLSVLWFSIWPNYRMAMQDGITEIMTMSDIHTLSNVWIFLTDGWSDYAERG
jgi:hypothetical protein